MQLQALEAMKEALKYLEKSRGIDKEKKVQSMQFQIQEVEQFVQVTAPSLETLEKWRAICSWDLKIANELRQSSNIVTDLQNIREDDMLLVLKTGILVQLDLVDLGPRSNTGTWKALLRKQRHPSLTVWSSLVYFN